MPLCEHKGTIPSVTKTDEGTVETKGFSVEGWYRILATAPAICLSCSGGSIIITHSLDEGPGKVAAGGTVVDDAEAELVTDSSGPPTRIGLRPNMSMLCSLNIPGAPYPLWVFQSIMHGSRNRKNLVFRTANKQQLVSPMKCCVVYQVVCLCIQGVTLAPLISIV